MPTWRKTRSEDLQLRVVPATAAPPTAWLHPVRLVYGRQGDQAIVELLGEMLDEHRSPESPLLIATAAGALHRAAALGEGTHAPGNGAHGPSAPVLWSASFMLPLWIVEHRSSRLALCCADRPAVDLARPAMLLNARAWRPPTADVAPMTIARRALAALGAGAAVALACATVGQGALADTAPAQQPATTSGSSTTSSNPVESTAITSSTTTGTTTTTATTPPTTTTTTAPPTTTTSTTTTAPPPPATAPPPATLTAPPASTSPTSPPAAPNGATQGQANGAAQGQTNGEAQGQASGGARGQSNGGAQARPDRGRARHRRRRSERRRRRHRAGHRRRAERHPDAGRQGHRGHHSRGGDRGYEHGRGRKHRRHGAADLRSASGARHVAPPSAVDPDDVVASYPFAAEPFSAVQLSRLVAAFSSSQQPPAFLVGIYKAAGRRYDIPWKVLAAINGIETDYGQDLQVSPAGAIGWMQFMPQTWLRWGISVDGRGTPNPYDPRDAIFSAARYLAASGAATNLRAAIFAYNHAVWYVDAVLWRARMITGGARPQLPPGYALPLDRRYMATLGRTDDGVDIEDAPDGAAVYSITPGIVTAVASDPTGFGPDYPVVLATAGPLAGQYIYYGHVAASLVTVGEHVLAGQPIAIVGHTGDAASLGHGHIEIGFCDSTGDPLDHHGPGPDAATPAGEAMRHVLIALSASFGVHNS